MNSIIIVDSTPDLFLRGLEKRDDVATTVITSSVIDAYFYLFVLKSVKLVILGDDIQDFWLGEGITEKNKFNLTIEQIEEIEKLLKISKHVAIKQVMIFALTNKGIEDIPKFCIYSSIKACDVKEKYDIDTIRKPVLGSPKINFFRYITNCVEYKT